MKRLMRNTQAGKVAGIAAGFADYFDVDVVLVRALFVVAIILTGLFPGILAYLVLWFLIPRRETMPQLTQPTAATGP
jgi:phage shock protein PspC (stress-responsive transcriptional regulator)